jgi:hypothetical protein
MATTLTGTDVRAWPSLSRAARFLGVDKSTLARRHDLGGEHVGQQAIHIAPGVVVRLAREYRRRIVEEVLFDLHAYVQDRAPDQLAALDAEVAHALEQNPIVARDTKAELLTFARDHLPASLYTQIEVALRADGSPGVLGEDPDA